MKNEEKKLNILIEVIEKTIQSRIQLGWKFNYKFFKESLELNDDEDFTKSIYLDDIKDIDLRNLSFYIKGLKKAKEILKNNFNEAEGKLYINNCWKCHGDIDNRTSPKCEKCKWYICQNCGACEMDCSGENADALKEALENF